MHVWSHGPRELHKEEIVWPPESEEVYEGDYFGDFESPIIGNFLMEHVTDPTVSTILPFASRTLDQDSSFEPAYEIDDLVAYDEDVWSLSYEGHEKIILDTIFSDTFQNLRGKNQHGPFSYFINRLGVSRFEHSVDTLFLLRWLGKVSEVEIEPELEIKTTDHDMGHGAGSHWSEELIDKDHEYHESRIDMVLEREGLKQVIEERYPGALKSDYALLDAQKPDLSVDRLAYILKDAQYLFGHDAPGEFSSMQNMPGDWPEENKVEWSDIGDILEDVRIHEEGDDRKVVMTDPESARRVAEIYMDLESQIYFNPGFHAVNEAFADATKVALNNKSISVEELFTCPDDVLMDLVARDIGARERLDAVFQEVVSGDGLNIVGQDSEDYHFEINMRRDVVDPLVREKPKQRLDDMRRASEICPDLKKELTDHKSSSGALKLKVAGRDYRPVTLSDDIVYSWDDVAETPDRETTFEDITFLHPRDRTKISYWDKSIKQMLFQDSYGLVNTGNGPEEYIRQS